MAFGCASRTDLGGVCSYVQMGNAVCPQVAAALGRCLALAAVGGVPAGQAVVDERDQAYDQVRAWLGLSMHVSCGCFRGSNLPRMWLHAARSMLGLGAACER